jgi:hypothetical protein
MRFKEFLVFLKALVIKIFLLAVIALKQAR